MDEAFYIMKSIHARFWNQLFDSFTNGSLSLFGKQGILYYVHSKQVVVPIYVDDSYYDIKWLT